MGAFGSSEKSSTRTRGASKPGGGGAAPPPPGREGRREVGPSESEPREKRSVNAEPFVRAALDGDIELRKLFDESYRILHLELLSPSKGKTQLAGKTLLDLSFGLEIAQRNVAAQGHEPFTFDARPRRIAVDDPRKDVERV